jgi:hypothetical protein
MKRLSIFILKILIRIKKWPNALHPAQPEKEKKWLMTQTTNVHGASDHLVQYLPPHFHI